MGICHKGITIFKPHKIFNFSLQQYDLFKEKTSQKGHFNFSNSKAKVGKKGLKYGRMPFYNMC